MDKEKFAKNLVSLRKQKGYTQQELADRLRVTNKAVSRWESGEGYPDITMLIPLGDALGVSCDDLLHCEKNYRDIDKNAIQKYLPYGLSLTGLLLYYILHAIGVPILVSTGILLFILVCSLYFMIHHTDKHRLPNLTRFNMIIFFFPIFKLLETIILIIFIMQASGVSPLILFTAAISPLNNSILSPENTTMDAFVYAYMLIYILSAIACSIVYCYLKRWFKRKYEIQWDTFLKEPTSQQKQRSYKISNLVTLVITALVFGYLYYCFYTYGDTAIQGQPYIFQNNQTILANMQFLLTIFLMPGIMYQGYALLRFHRQWTYIRNMLILGPYLGMIIWSTYFDGIYLTSPLRMICFGGIAIVILLGGERWKKKISLRKQADA